MSATHPTTSHAPGHDPHHRGHQTVGHIVPLPIYLAVWIALMVLLALTVGAARMDLGAAGNWVILLAIAITKTLLVVLFFMHVKYAPKIIWVILGAAVLWLITMMGLFMTDYISRSWTMSGSESETPAHATPFGAGELGPGGEHRTGEHSASPR